MACVYTPLEARAARIDAASLTLMVFYPPAPSSITV